MAYVARVSSLPRILVVDDDATILRAMSRMLERLGFAVTATVRPLEALERLLTDATFVGAIADLEMPELGGPELRASLARAGIALPVLVISGNFDPSDTRDGELAKPFDRHALRAALARIGISV